MKGLDLNLLPPPIKKNDKTHLQFTLNTHKGFSGVRKCSVTVILNEKVEELKQRIRVAGVVILLHISQ